MRVWACARSPFFALAALGFAFSGAIPARADPRTPEWSAAALVGYGHEIVQGLNGLGLGLGVRGGRTFGFGGYVGASFVAHLGSGERGRAPDFSYANRHYEETMALEIGYDLRIGGRLLVLRPYLALGLLVDNARTRVGESTLTNHDVYGFVGPCVDAHFRWRDLLVGIDLRLPLFPSQFLPRLTTSVFFEIGLAR